MKKINLEEIFMNNSDCYTEALAGWKAVEEPAISKEKFIEIMKVICKQTLELAAENARISHFYYDKWEDSKLYEKYKDSGFQRCDGDGVPYGVDIEFINKDSILNTINQIE